MHKNTIFTPLCPDPFLLKFSKDVNLACKLFASDMFLLKYNEFCNNLLQKNYFKCNFDWNFIQNSLIGHL
jgi:hypothetical protein